MHVTASNKRRFSLAALIIFVRVCCGLVWSSAGPLLSMVMQEYSINRGTVGWYGSIAPVVITSLSVPISTIGLRVGVKKLFAVGAFFQASCLVAPLISSFAGLLVSRIVFAFGVAITAPIVSRIFVEWFSARELPFINGLTMAMVNIGGSIAYFATVPTANAISWQWTLALYGAMALCSALAWLVWGDKHDKTSATAIRRPDRPAQEKDGSGNIGQILRQRGVIFLIISLVGPYCLGTVLGFWLPTYYHEVFGMSLATGSSVTAIFSLTSAAACLVGGILPTRLGVRRPFLIFPGLLMGLLAMGCFMFNNIAVIVICAALFGIANSLHMASILTIPMELPGLTPYTGAMVLVLTLGVANIGNFIGPIIVGYLADLTGSYLPGLIICCALSLTLLVAGVFLPETGPGKRPVKAIAIH